MLCKDTGFDGCKPLFLAAALTSAAQTLHLLLQNAHGFLNQKTHHTTPAHSKVAHAHASTLIEETKLS